VEIPKGTAMKSKPLTFSLAALLAAVEIGWHLFHHTISANNALRGQEKKLEALNEQLAAREKMTLLELQKECSSHAERVSKYIISDLGPGVPSYTNHYNAKLDKCCVLVRWSGVGGEGGAFRKYYLYDACENRCVAQYVWRLAKGKETWEARPMQCSDILPSGQYQSCNSAPEFDSLCRIYMEDEIPPASTAPAIEKGTP
jgi:hypothetical protein